MIDFCNFGYYHGLMKPDLRISVKDNRRSKSRNPACAVFLFPTMPILDQAEHRTIPDGPSARKMIPFPVRWERTRLACRFGRPAQTIVPHLLRLAPAGKMDGTSFSARRRN